ncbi:hypothetical protein L7F22_006612 [Adiantum nelumboides]|nr:hypothetical protein [Adiantum nelumboides]
MRAPRNSLRRSRCAASGRYSGLPAPAISDDKSSLAIPLRVIDVSSTIENREAGGIHFTRSRIWHVISHTWSADIRAFSSIVGEKQKLINGQAYEALFQSAGFHCHPAYEKLIELLMILQTQHVRWAWFDAVCINQADKEEKDHEIQHMGTYYQKSMGCYVLQHGISKAFQLLLENDEIAFDSSCEEGASLLPRWFTRAWTLQEWVLPPLVNFILDLALEQCLCTIACKFFLKTNSGSCICCMYDTSINPKFLHGCLLEHAEVHVLQCQKGSDLCSKCINAEREMSLCTCPTFYESSGEKPLVLC